MKARKTLKGASMLGIKVKRDKSLDKFFGKVLFPEKVAQANKVIANLIWSVSQP